MDSMRSSQSLGAALRKSQISDLAFLLQFCHCPDGLLDWHVRINAMLIVQINLINTQPFQRIVARLMNIFSVSSDNMFPIDKGVRKLGAQEDLSPATSLLEPFSE